MRRLRSAVALAASAGALASPGGAAALDGDRSGDTDAADQCVVRVTGHEESGRLLTTAPVCHPTIAEALAYAGVDLGKGGSDLTFEEIEESGALAAAADSSGLLGVHWDGANRTGASITITGGACSGGHHNLASSWVNRISSTWNGCPSVLFYDGFDKSGSHELTTTSTVNLGALNNASNSIGYAT